LKEPTEKEFSLLILLTSMPTTPRSKGPMIWVLTSSLLWPRKNSSKPISEPSSPPAINKLKRLKLKSSFQLEILIGPPKAPLPPSRTKAAVAHAGLSPPLELLRLLAS
jgi:hypothetical protein